LGFIADCPFEAHLANWAFGTDFLGHLDGFQGFTVKPDGILVSALSADIKFSWACSRTQ
jgi:hypothetical protein